MSNPLKTVCSSVAEDLRETVEAFISEDDFTTDQFTSMVLQAAARLQGAADATPDVKVEPASVFIPPPPYYEQWSQQPPFLHRPNTALHAGRYTPRPAPEPAPSYEDDQNVAITECVGGPAGGSFYAREQDMPHGQHVVISGARYQFRDGLLHHVPDDAPENKPSVVA